MESGATGTPPDCGPGKDVDSAAQSAAAGQHRAADIKLLCLDSTSRPDARELEELRSETDPASDRRLDEGRLAGGRRLPPQRAVGTSSLTGEGLDALRGAGAPDRDCSAEAATRAC